MAATDQTTNPALSLVPTDEERMLRETVRKICADFGPEYSRRKTAAGEPPTRAVGRARQPRLPEREPAGGVRRRRARDVRAGCGRRGDLRERLLAAADRRVARDRRQHPRAPRQRGAEGRLAARHRGGHDEGRVRDHGAGRRLELAQPVHLGAPLERRLHDPRREDLHLRRRGLRRDPGRDPRARRRRQPGAAAAVHRRLGRARAREAAHPDRAACARQAVDALLRRRRGAGRPADRLRDRRAEGRLRRPQPGAHHGRRGRLRRGAAGARDGVGVRARARRVEGRRSARTRGSRTRWRRRRSSSSWRG